MLMKKTKTKPHKLQLQIELNWAQSICDAVFLHFTYSCASNRKILKIIPEQLTESRNTKAFYHYFEICFLLTRF